MVIKVAIQLLSFLDRSGAYEVAVRFLGDPEQTLADEALFRVLSLGPLDFLPLYKLAMACLLTRTFLPTAVRRRWFLSTPLLTGLLLL